MGHTTHTEEHKGYTIHIQYDDHPQNPWEDWDCEPPVAYWFGDRTLQPHLAGDCRTAWADPDRPPIEHLTRDKIAANYAAIVERLDPEIPLLIASGESFKTTEELVQDGWSAYYEGLYQSEKLTELSVLLDWLGIPNRLGTSTGFSQGCWAEVLVALTPDWCERVGYDISSKTPEELEATMKATHDLFSAWAWGDTWGWVVKDAEGDMVESCWGYYGPYPEYGGAIEDAKGCVDGLTEQSTKQLEATQPTAA